MTRAFTLLTLVIVPTLIGYLLVTATSCDTCLEYVNSHGVVFDTLDQSWLTAAEAETEEHEAAVLVADQFGLNADDLIGLVAGTHVNLVTVLPICGRPGFYMGCAHFDALTNTDWIRILVTAKCARRDATYRHEIAHVMLRKTGHDDPGHRMAYLWRALDKQGDCQ